MDQRERVRVDVDGSFVAHAPVTNGWPAVDYSFALDGLGPGSHTISLTNIGGGMTFDHIQLTGISEPGTLALPALGG